MRRWIPIAVGLAIAGLCAWLAVRQVDWPAALRALAGADWTLLALTIPLLLSSVLLRAWRWWLILRAYPLARFGPLVLAAGIGLGANAILPGKLGEAVAAHALGRLADLSRIQSLGIMAVTRVVDVLILFALVLLASIYLPSPALESLRSFSLGVVLVAGVVLGLPLLLRRDRAPRLVTRLRGIVERKLGAAAVDVAGKFARGLASAGRPDQLVGFIVSTILLWLMLTGSLVVALRAFAVPIALVHVPLVMGLIAASAMLPSAPGNVGTMDYFGILALTLVGVETGVAAACIIAYHVLDLVCALLLGAVCAAVARTPLMMLRTPATQVVAQRAIPEAEVGGRLSLASESLGMSQRPVVHDPAAAMEDV